MIKREIGRGHVEGTERRARHGQVTARMKRVRVAAVAFIVRVMMRGAVFARVTIHGVRVVALGRA